MLVGVARVVFLGNEVHEQAVGQRFVSMRIRAGDVERDRVVVTDVLREHLAAVAIENDHAHHPRQTHEEIVLTALVVVQAADHAALRPGEVGLPDRLRQRSLASELGEPAALVLVARQREALDFHVARTKSLTA